ncbi:hypothetical protein CFC21_069201 [Triticum aestivum]|uniref:Bowman-Birk serine protease inhibitors family domain-containing protein n=3 Tax=Triticum TaxID=4564 RepID=A0A9R0WWF9_TRITD|nr:hypothetical protein CFC21_069201 [Triticum aestivum]VAI25640.1 unnamed protein product [Triticum turgidum subsp. durum]
MASPSPLKMLAVVCVLVLVGLSLSQQATASGCDDCADGHNPAACAPSQTSRRACMRVDWYDAKWQ